MYTVIYMIILIRQLNYNMNMLCEEYEDDEDEEDEEIYDDMPPLVSLSGDVNESDMPELISSEELNKRFESVAESDNEPIIRMSEKEMKPKVSSESHVLSQLKQVVDETNARNLRRRAREPKRES